MKWGEKRWEPTCSSNSFSRRTHELGTQRLREVTPPPTMSTPTVTPPTTQQSSPSCHCPRVHLQGEGCPPSACRMRFSLFLSTGKTSLFGDRRHENVSNFDVMPLCPFEIPGFLSFLLLAKILYSPNIVQDSACPRDDSGIDGLSRIWFFRQTHL